MTVAIIRQTTPKSTARVTREYVLANSHRALVEQAARVVAEAISRTREALPQVPGGPEGAQDHLKAVP